MLCSLVYFVLRCLLRAVAPSARSDLVGAVHRETTVGKVPELGRRVHLCGTVPAVGDRSVRNGLVVVDRDAAHVRARSRGE